MKIIFIIIISSIIFCAESKSDSELWPIIQKKFNNDLAKDFTNQDVESWLEYFAPNKKINIYQYGSDVSGENGDGQTIKVYTGPFLCSIVRGRMPAKLMAKTVFKRLKKQDYKKSRVELLAILQKDSTLSAYVRFERINSSGKVYQSAKSVYTMTNINEEWYIIEMSTYDDSFKTNEVVGYDKMWYPH